MHSTWECTPGISSNNSQELHTSLRPPCQALLTHLTSGCTRCTLQPGGTLTGWGAVSWHFSMRRCVAPCKSTLLSQYSANSLYVAVTAECKAHCTGKFFCAVCAADLVCGLNLQQQVPHIVGGTAHACPLTSTALHAAVLTASHKSHFLYDDGNCSLAAHAKPYPWWVSTRL